MSRLLILICLFYSVVSNAQSFRVIGFYTAREDAAHISFVHEANRWFRAQAKQYGFEYDSTDDWTKLNKSVLAKYDVVLFFDTRPETPEQRAAFQDYMEHGGGWLGFHFAGFALTPSAYPQNWDWYHLHFLGAGSYASNTWRPTSAVLKAEDSNHPILSGIPSRFTASPNEWYRWENDLRMNDSIQILLSIDSSSFPLGTGPKQYEIWHSGYYPIVWTNRFYHMVYFNMGHNDIDYEGKTNRELSFQFTNPTQNKLILNSLFWVARKRMPASKKLTKTDNNRKPG
jgi:hypothetical protein